MTFSQGHTLHAHQELVILISVFSRVFTVGGKHAASAEAHPRRHGVVPGPVLRAQSEGHHCAGARGVPANHRRQALA